jgi:hypothetical protein
VEFYRLLRRQHEIESRSCWPTIRERCLHATRRNFSLTHKGDTDVTAGRIWREIKDPATILECMSLITLPGPPGVSTAGLVCAAATRTLSSAIPNIAECLNLRRPFEKVLRSEDIKRFSIGMVVSYHFPG